MILIEIKRMYVIWWQIFIICCIFIFIYAFANSTKDKRKVDDLCFESQDSIKIIKEKLGYDHAFFNTINGVDYYSVHFKDKHFMELYSIENKDTIKFNIPNEINFTNGNATFLNDSILVYLKRHFLKDIVELFLIKPSGEYTRFLDTIKLLDSSVYLTQTFSTKMVPLKCYGNNIFIPLWTTKKSNPKGVFPNIPGAKGASCELRYTIDVGKMKMKFKGTIGTWPKKYVNRNQIDVWCHRNFFTTKKGDSLAVYSFSESDTVYIYTLDGVLKNSIILGESTETDFPKDEIIPDLNFQFARYMNYKTYSTIWADEFGIYRLTRYPTDIAKDEFRKRRTYEKKTSLLVHLLDKKPSKYEDWYEIKFNTPKEWYPYFLGKNGLYVLSKNVIYDSNSTTTFYNRYNICN